MRQSFHTIRYRFFGLCFLGIVVALSGCSAFTGEPGNAFQMANTNNTTASCGEAGTFLAKWGSLGSGDGQFHDPADVGVDDKGDLYVVDRENSRIQKFNASGVYVAQWGSNGNGVGQFSYPSGVSEDRNYPFVAVADTANNRIQLYDHDNKFVYSFGSFGNGDGQLSGPQAGVFIFPSVALLVSDGGNHRLQWFDMAGGNGIFLKEVGSEGSGDGQFSFPSDIVVDSTWNFYVADTGNHRIQKFAAKTEDLSVRADFLTKWGSNGSGDGQFSFPSGLAVDSKDNIYVADTGNHRIQKFDVSGNFLTKWGSEGSGDGQFSSPSGVAVDSQGNVYVADTGNHRIQKFCGGVIEVDPAP